MAYDIDSLKKGKNAPGATLETSDVDVTPAGVYKHPESGETLITRDHPLFGNAQSEGVIRAGFVYDRPVEPGEVTSIVETILNDKNASNDDLKGLSARLRELEAANDVSDADKAELAAFRAKARDEQLASTTGAEDSLNEAVKAGEAQGTALAANADTQTNETVSEPQEEATAVKTKDGKK